MCLCPVYQDITESSGFGSVSFSLQHHVIPLGKGLYFVQWDTCQAGNSGLYWGIHVKCHQIKTGRKIFPRTVSCMHLVTRKVEVKSLVHCRKILGTIFV